jgi:hypothetical protein
VSETSVASYLEESFDVLSEFGLEDVGGHLQILALLVVPLSVEEPSGDTVAFGVVDDIGNGIALSLSEFSGSKFWVDSKDLADEESKPSSHTFNFVKCEGDGSLTVNVGVEDTMNVFEGILSVFDDE